MSRSFAQTTRSLGASIARSSVWRLSRRHIERIAVPTRSTWHFLMVAKSSCFHFQSRPRALHIRKRVDCAISRSLSTISTVLSPLFGVAEFSSKTCASMSSPENDSHSLQIPMDSLSNSMRSGLRGFSQREFFGKIARALIAGETTFVATRVHTVEGGRRGDAAATGTPIAFP